MHDVKALVASEKILRRMVLEFKTAIVCPLVQNLALVPITEDLARELEIHFIESEEPWLINDMAAGVASAASRLSSANDVAYVSTEYFGGVGGQRAIVWRAERIVFQADNHTSSSAGWPNSPISRALRFMGVKAAEGEDEFDTIGLGKYRSTEEWGETSAQA